jgi:hypothetical protein
LAGFLVVTTYLFAWMFTAWIDRPAIALSHRAGARFGRTALEPAP